MNDRYLFDSVRDYKIMNQQGVRQCVVPNPTLHNACWDSILAPDGRIYLSLCSELTTSEYAKLAVFDPEKNEITPLHYTKDIIFPNERNVRDSKFHTSMAWMNDGRLVMLTHTTDKAPAHPWWMPAPYYNHPWEGYPGSSLLTYDPQTGKMENWGIPVRRETIYGAAYDRIHNVYYGIGFLNGGLYGIDLNHRSVRNYGQVVEKASYRLVVGSDQNIYFTTRNGLLQRINTRTREVENLNIQLPYQKIPGRFRPYLTYAVNGPDGKLYMTGMHDERLSCYDPATGEFTVIGAYMPAKQTTCGIETNSYLGCMGFDKNRVLYYIICSLRKDAGEDHLVPSVLMRWDFFHGGKPELLGLAGTKERVTAQSCSMIMDHARDRMYIIGTNHAIDGPNLITVDLAAYRDHATELGEVTTDALMFPGNGQYEKHAASMKNGHAVQRQNPIGFSYGTALCVPLWRQFTDAERENAHVAALSWEKDVLRVICGKDQFTEFTIAKDGKILSSKPCGAPAEKAAPAAEAEKLPYYPGRQYKRAAVRELPLSGGRRLLATADGLLAIEREDGSVYSLGPAWVNGPVNDMTVDPQGNQVYGVAGDPDDINIVFSYNDKEGLRWLGHATIDDKEYGKQNSPRLTAIALHENAVDLAVGAGGRMGCVYLYSKE